MLIISCHADTGFFAHRLRNARRGHVIGHLDNFAGVHAVMLAYFSGRMRHDHLRIELTYGEETDFGGALEVRKSLRTHDVVVVVDVTGTPTRKDLVIEKCSDPVLQELVLSSLDGMRFDLYEDCPDPISDSDEVDVYQDKGIRSFFLGIPCRGGDYNEGEVSCSRRSLEALAEALCRITEAFPRFCREQGIPIS